MYLYVTLSLFLLSPTVHLTQRPTLRRYGLDWFRAGLLSEEPLARALSHWELCLAGDSPALRQLVYGEESGDTWQVILERCCAQVDEQTQRLLVVLKRREDELHKKRRMQGVRTAGGVNANASGALWTARQLYKEVLSGRNGMQRAKTRVQALGSDLLRYVNPIPDPTMRYRRPSSYKPSTTTREQSGEALEEVLTFRESLRRQYGPWWWWYKPNLILGGELSLSLFSECRTTLWAIQGAWLGCDVWRGVWRVDVCTCNA
jgi:hypothetical protein